MNNGNCVRIGYVCSHSQQAAAHSPQLSDPPSEKPHAKQPIRNWQKAHYLLASCCSPNRAGRGQSRRRGRVGADRKAAGKPPTARAAPSERKSTRSIWCAAKLELYEQPHEARGASACEHLEMQSQDDGPAAHSPPTHFPRLQINARSSIAARP